MEKEYRLDIKLKNNILLKIMEKKGYKTVGEFCRKNKLCQTSVGPIVNMTMSPLKSNGDFRDIVIKISLIFDVLPEMLFSENQLTSSLNSNKRTLELSEAEAIFMLNNGNEDSYMLEDIVLKDQLNNRIDDVLSKLTPRESKILSLRFGLHGGDEHTLEDVAKIYDLSGDRVRQIQLKALRKIRFIDEKYKIFDNDVV